MVSAIRLEDLHVTYRSGLVPVEAVRGVDLEIESGEFIAIEGPSGSGKSTLLRAMAGLWPATSGCVMVEGLALGDRSDAQLAILRRRRIGFVHQLFNLLPDLDVRDNVGLPLLLDGIKSKEVDERVRDVLARLGIEEKIGRRPQELSGGQMLRVALARALVIRPLIVLADEPTGSLDQAGGRRVLELLQRLHRAGDLTLVIVTHDQRVAENATRRLYLVDGRLS